MIKKQVEQYYDLIKECFSTDPELLSTWHIESGKGIDSCTIRTCKDLADADVEIYALELDNKVIGYFGVELDLFMSGFFIKPEHRNKEVIKEFWSVVDDHFEDEYMVGLYKKNTPAIEFLKKKTPSYYELDDEAVFFVISKGDESCH